MDNNALTPLHPNYVPATRIAAALGLLPLLAGAIAIEVADLLPAGLIFVPFGLLALVVIVLIPLRRYRSRGYDMAADRLRVVKGVLFHADSVVPFSRVQHIDVEQGPIERAFGISRLILHTAGTHNSSVTLPGLGHEDAITMREEIRAHVKRESV